MKNPSATDMEKYLAMGATIGPAASLPMSGGHPCPPAEVAATKKVTARSVRREVGVMNKLETRYAARLTDLVMSGKVLSFKFDAIKLRLADKCFYTPDFMVVAPNGEIEIHEVKGFWEDDARVKIKVAAAMYPFRFMAVQWIEKEWKFEEL